MFKATIIALAEISAINAEINGMLAINTERARDGYSLAYDEGDFLRKADELRKIGERLMEKPPEEENHEP
jgi:hypothetical protein